MTDTVDITTQIGCPVQCTKYCPQELIVKRYKGERHLALDNFKKFIYDIPISTEIRFVGDSEPFVNQETPDMIIWAYEKGHPIVVYSTLVGLTPANAARILFIPFKQFILHLPDAENNAKIPLTQDYLTVLGMVLTHVHNITYMHMGNDFVSNEREMAARGLIRKRKNGNQYCRLFDDSNYQIHPNGNVHFCCYTTIDEKVGSLHDSTYSELRSPESFNKQVKRMKTDPHSLCHICFFAKPAWMGYFVRAKSKWLGDESTVSEIIFKKLSHLMS
jgi:hypothetical protein